MSFLDYPAFTAKSFTFDDMQAVHADWAALLGKDLSQLDTLYDTYFEVLERLTRPAASLGATDRLSPQPPALETLYRFVICFGWGTYLRAYGAVPATHQRLKRRHGEHLALIRKLIDHADDPITDRHLLSDTGRWGDLATSAIGVYIHHVPYGAEGRELRRDASLLIPDLLHAFADQSSGTLLHLLEDHPEAEACIADVLIRYLRDERKPSAGVVQEIAREMMGFYARRDDRFHEAASTILEQVLVEPEIWSDGALADLVRHVLLKPLNLAIRSPEEELADLQESIEELRKNAAKGPPVLIISTKQQAEMNQKMIRARETEMAKLKADFAGWVEDRRDRAVQRIAVSTATRHALETASKVLPKGFADEIDALLTDAGGYPSRPKVFPIADKSENRFKDFGLKLLVIEELMYVQKVLKPAFDIRAFAKEWDKREISIDRDGYNPIPEAEQYFANLPISEDLLARVETLHQSSGLDGDSRVIYHLHPFWDPGVGHEAIPVTDEAIGDLPLLPNLRLISGLENSAPSPELLKALDDRNIRLIDEEARYD